MRLQNAATLCASVPQDVRGQPTEYRQEFLRDDATCALDTHSDDTVAFHGTASADRAADTPPVARVFALAATLA
jgi:hypothetical protein